MSQFVKKLKSKRRKRLATVAALVLIVLIWAGLWVSHLYHSKPAGWEAATKHLDGIPQEQRDQIAQQLENRLAEQLSFADQYDEHGRPLPDHSSQRTIVIPSDQINNWIDQRLPRWLKNHNVSWPGGVGAARFWTDGGRAVIGCYINAKGLNRVVSVALDVTIDSQADDAVLRLEGAWIGRLRVPLSTILDMLTARLDATGEDEAARFLRDLAAGYHFPPVLEIGGEQYRFTAIRAVQDGLEIDLRQD